MQGGFASRPGGLVAGAPIDVARAESAKGEECGLRESLGAATRAEHRDHRRTGSLTPRSGVRVIRHNPGARPPAGYPGEPPPAGRRGHPTGRAAPPARASPPGHGARRSAAGRPSVSTSTVGPAPETTAGSPSARSAPPARGSRHRRLAVAPGGAGPRWRRAAARAAGSAPPPAARPGRRWRPRRRAGTDVRQQPPRHRVSTPSGGTNTTTCDPRVDRERRRARNRSPSAQAIVNPPYSAGATLSGCPSRSAASANTASSSISSEPPATRPRAAQTPATIAADDEPSPRPCGITLSHSAAAPGVARPCASNARPHRPVHQVALVERDLALAPRRAPRSRRAGPSRPRR